MVGCGAFARGFHLPNIAANPRAELAVACDLDAGLAEKCRQEFNGRRSSGDWHEVIQDPEVDLIVLVTHTALRSELILPALQAGKLGLRREAPGQHGRGDARHRPGRPGDGGPLSAWVTTSGPAPRFWISASCSGRSGGAWSAGRLRWIARPADSGAGIPEEEQIQILMRVDDDCRSWVDWIFSDPQGILFAEMVHFIDLALWLNPSPPVRVFAEGSARGELHPDPQIPGRFADHDAAFPGRPLRCPEGAVRDYRPARFDGPSIIMSSSGSGGWPTSRSARRTGSSRRANRWREGSKPTTRR